jgi:SNF2 family DNA or RNA helicase
MPGFLKPLPPGLRGEERSWHDERLRAQTAPYILRRTKAAVAPELPEKIEQVIYCDLLPAQAALYRRMQEDSERALFDLEAGGASENAIRLATLTQLLRLRQICCDPRLVEGRSPRASDRDRPSRVDAPTPAPYADSAKLEAFRELLDEALDEGHRLLVFSQFTSLLALIREELETSGTAYAYLDGSMPARARQAEVDRFQSDDRVPVFLLSLKAGGTGLNLTGADTVVHLDPWWNPAVEAQATDRAHRIGQTRVVTSYKLICSGTVEEKVMALQDQKRALLADVFEASDAAAARLGVDDLKALLRT